jgi:periplasmic protein TonB
MLLRTSRDRARYALTVQVGIIASLLFLIGLFSLHIPAPPAGPSAFAPNEEPPLRVEHVVPTTHETREAPPPPAPLPPVAALEVPEIADDPIVWEPFEAPREWSGPPAIAIPPEPPAPDDTEPFVVVEDDPVLIGGLEGLQRRIAYPASCRLARVEGTVFIQFVVDEAGRVESAEVVRGIGAGCDEAALQAILEAEFEPGRQRGQPVRVRSTLPVRFRLR